MRPGKDCFEMLLLLDIMVPASRIAKSGISMTELRSKAPIGRSNRAVMLH